MANKKFQRLSEETYSIERNNYWNASLGNIKLYESVRSYYRKRLIEIYTFLIPDGLRVIELGCGKGDLISATKPSYGVGVDFAENILNIAKNRHPQINFLHTDVHNLNVAETFDYIICSDLVNELWDVQTFFSNLTPLCHPQTRLILNIHSNLWQFPRKLASKVGLARPQMAQNWLTPKDVSNLLYLSDFEIIRTSNEVLWPFRTPFLDSFFNRILVKIWPFCFLGLTSLVIARPKPKDRLAESVVSVVVPARGEAGNIKAIFDRMPQMGLGTEIIFVEGGSPDDTYEVIQREMNIRKRPLTKLFKQTGKGKGDAVRLGFANASGEVLMILDADLTVEPEDLPRFYEAWLTGKADFINGVRMVYPM